MKRKKLVYYHGFVWNLFYKQYALYVSKKKHLNTPL